MNPRSYALKVVSRVKYDHGHWADETRFDFTDGDFALFSKGGSWCKDYFRPGDVVLCQYGEPGRKGPGAIAKVLSFGENGSMDYGRTVEGFYTRFVIPQPGNPIADERSPK